MNTIPSFSFKIYLIVLLLFSGTVRSQEMVVPLDAQLELLSKILTFNRTLSPRNGHTLVVAILYQRVFRPSNTARTDFLKFTGSGNLKTLGGIPYRVLSFEIMSTMDEIDSALLDMVDILYATPLRSVDMNDVQRVTRRKQILTVTGVPQYVEGGLALGIDMKGQKPQILINLPAAKAEGADFSARLLNLARVIR
ncbi:MAG: YfiR family protein [Bacteroidota bacterium]